MVLTLLGGGVFGNDLAWIVDAIRWARGVCVCVCARARESRAGRARAICASCARLKTRAQSHVRVVRGYCARAVRAGFVRALRVV